ncbi:hypothetical protein OK074_5391 [Actinobacteria bacterium OK074]|nr:hypothetical protein OK074_5391 [Actinobacteria bacterium OK074]
MSFVVYLAAVVFGASSLLLFRRPRQALRDPLTASTCVSIALGATCFACAAPATLAAVNSLTGIPNFGAPLTYSMISAYSCSLLILLINWRGGPRERTRRMVVRTVTAYGLVIVAIIVLFTLADADTERLRDLDTYYATTPYMREMILLYLVGHSAASVLLCALCVKWGHEVHGPLRVGLRLIMLGILLDVLGFQLTKYTALVARWTGHDLDVLSTTVAPPTASLGALICSAGFVLPRFLPVALANWRSLGDYRTLGPLWAELRFLATAPKPPAAWWQPPRERLHWREISIHDALLALAPHFDDHVRTTAYDGAVHTGRPAHEARAIAEAVMVTDAARRAAAAEEPRTPASTYRLHATEVSGTGTASLVELARALVRCPAATACAPAPTPAPAPPRSVKTQ